MTEAPKHGDAHEKPPEGGTADPGGGRDGDSGEPGEGREPDGGLRGAFPGHGDEAPVTLTGASPRAAASRPPPVDRSKAGQGPPSVLSAIQSMTGVEPRVLLKDEGSEHGVSPVIQAGGDPETTVPEGRGSYQVLGEIARGGMGVILKGHDADLGRDVAMKVLMEKHATNPAILQRFVEEAQIGGQLQHPGIVPVYEMGLMADDRPYFTMKLVKGRTLGALLAERKDATVDRQRFLSIFEDVCQTMAYAHARQVIHRDLKPANIMVGAFGEVQVVDWGLAKVMREGGVEDDVPAPVPAQTEVSIIETVRSSGSSAGSSESLAGSVMGTPAYMSPEQAQGEIDRLDERTDVFALGAILCQILTGQPPYIGEQGSVLEEAARTRQEGAHRRLDESGADPELVALTKRCLAPARSSRPAGAEGLVQEVQAWMATQEQRTQAAQVAAAEARVKASNAVKARRLTLALAAAVLVIVAGGGGGWLWLDEQHARRQAQTADEVGALLADASLMRGRGAYDEALSAAERAETALAAGEGSPDLEARVTDMLVGIRAEAEMAQAEQDRASRTANLFKQLDAVLFSSNAGTWAEREQEERDASFRQAFADYGIDLESGDVQQIIAAIEATGDPSRVGLALDEWARTKRRLRGWRSTEFQALMGLAGAVDPDPVRGEMRTAILAEDRRALEALASSKAALTWPPATVAMFRRAVGDMGFVFDMEGMLRSCHGRHPDNATISFMLGDVLEEEAPEEALRYYIAAYSVRPNYAPALYRASKLLLEAGDWDAAAHTYAGALVRVTDAEWLRTARMADIINPMLAADHEGAMILMEACLERDPRDGEVMMLLGWRLLSRDDRRLRDPERAKALALKGLEPETATKYETETLGILAEAHYELDELSECLVVMEQYFAKEPEDDIPDPYFVRALALARLDRRAEAEIWFAKGVEAANAYPAEEDDELDLYSREIILEAEQMLGLDSGLL